MVDTDPSSARADWRLAVSAYVGALAGGMGGVVASIRSPAVVAAVLGCAIGFAIGGSVGVHLADRIDELAVRIGRNRRRRWSLGLPVVAFAALWLRSATANAIRWSGEIALGAAVALLLVGWVVAALARAVYVTATVPDEPILTVPWEPPGSVTADLALVGIGLFVAAANTVDGDRSIAILSVGFAVSRAIASVIEARVVPLRAATSPEIRVHDAGLVVQRPFTRSFVPWDDVRHVRLKDGELVLDRGIRDVRFDRDELGDPDGLVASIERASPGTVLPAG
ncbi:PH domain-containing protein [Halovivax limisalsi]|uniref:PH domain-containing protein n=1 Tax=Halovivax limisalsi TaxID=1453760 RepID=UPI001FFCCCEE|nr:PH domain-containing protein [Halovivax limisalsi]